MKRFTSKDFVFINQDSGYLMIDIIDEYVNAGFNCTLITGRLVVRNRPLSNSVNIEKIIKYDRSSSLKRIFTWSWAGIQILWIILTKYRTNRLFIVSNPPIAPLLPLLLKNPFSLLIFDIFPDALSELGYLDEKSILIKLWSRANRKLFNRAERIFTISEGMQYVLKKYLTAIEPEVIPVWTDNTFLKPITPSSNTFLKKNNLTGKFIVMYSGNIGLSGDLNALIEVAAAIRRDDIIFVIIGHGAKRQIIQNNVIDRKLSNVVFLPWQPPVELPNSLAAASLAVVTLGKHVSKLAVPSKFYNFLSVGAPLLCITSPGSEIELLVKKYNCGGSYEPGDIAGIGNYIILLADNPVLLREIKLNSLKASGDFQKDNAKRFLPNRPSFT